MLQPRYSFAISIQKVFRLHQNSLAWDKLLNFFYGIYYFKCKLKKYEVNSQVKSSDVDMAKNITNMKRFLCKYWFDMTC